MAKLTLKIVTTGEEFDISDIDLNHTTPREIIDYVIKPEHLSAKTRSNIHIVLIDKNNFMTEDLDLPFAQLGFVDGDTVKICTFEYGGGENLAINVPNNTIYTYVPMPQENSNEDSTQQDACHESVMSQIEQMQCLKFNARHIIDRLMLQQYEHCGIIEDRNVAYFQNGLSRFDSISKLKEMFDQLSVMLLHSSTSLSIDDTLDFTAIIRNILEEIESERMGMMLYLDKMLMRKTGYNILSLLNEDNSTLSNDENCTTEEGRDCFIKSYLSFYEKCCRDLDKKEEFIHRVRVEKEKLFDVYSSIFAPAEVKRNSHMLIQIYLHLFEETEKIKALAQESQKNAERRDYIPLQYKLKIGDVVDIKVEIYGDSLLMSYSSSVVWQGVFTKCSFDFFVPDNINVEELSVVALLCVNNVPVGEMRFITQVVDTPRQLNPNIISHKYNKVFISYSHLDESKVKFLHEGLELGSIPNFFDHQYLKPGDVFPKVIEDYINSADLFILCWSRNASASSYVQTERRLALKRAYPQVQPAKAATLRIYPISIEPYAQLPEDMRDYYHFGEL